MALELRRYYARSIGRLLTLVVIGLFATLIRNLALEPGVAGNALLLGFLLLAAFVAGELARDISLPRITGYLVIGILFGPYVLRLMPHEAVEDFELINHVALAVIALQAGGELRLHRIVERMRSIISITVAQILIIGLGAASVVYLARDLFPFLRDEPTSVVVAVAMLFGVVAVAKSPATTIAVITELKARGQVTDTVLGVSVLKDVVILLLVAVILPAATVLVRPDVGFDFAQLREISFDIAQALTIGVLVGTLIGLYLKRINIQPILFVLAIAFIVIELAHALGLESEAYILMGIAAGFVVQNYSVQGPKFIEALEANSLPLYALFFAVAGADLDLGVIPEVWQACIVLILTRMAFVYVSTGLGARLAGDPPVIRRNAWMGFLAKAGVTLGLATIISERFPEWGEPVAAIIIAMVAFNQLIGPPLFRYSLVRSGESHA
jgi:Kef-type K+ transport system membrane component KefB